MIEGLERAIDGVKAAAVFVGARGEGPWQRREIEGILISFIEDDEQPVIPVLLRTAPPGTAPRLPLFLRAFTWVDFRGPGGQPLRRLCYGITGDKAR